MTLISKTLNEVTKKSDNMEEPLVENMVVEPHEKDAKCDIETGGIPVPPPKYTTTRFIITARSRPYYTLMLLSMLLLLLATCLLGIFGTEFLAQQLRIMKRTQVVEQPSPYESSALYEANILEQAGFESDTQNLEIQLNDEIVDDNSVGFLDGEHDEDNIRFVHDFYSNLTAIVDLGKRRCFIMPLDREAIMPPKTLTDLLKKLKNRYYSMNIEKVREDMRLGEHIEDLSNLGDYIKRECDSFDSYRLYKISETVITPDTEEVIEKRSIEKKEVFSYFDGKRLKKIYIHEDADYSLKAEAAATPA